MSRLDPFSIQWPDKWLSDPQISPVINYLDRYLHALGVVLDNGNAIDNLEVTQTTEDGGNRTYRRFRDEIDNLEGEIAHIKRQNKALEQQVYELKYLVSQTKSISRLAEQNIIELTERFDSGT